MVKSVVGSCKACKKLNWAVGQQYRNALKTQLADADVPHCCHLDTWTFLQRYALSTKSPPHEAFQCFNQFVDSLAALENALI